MNENSGMLGQASSKGLVPEEKADNRQINVSTGEYVLPAEVVRYYGVEKISSLVKKAMEGLSQMEQQGQVENPPVTGEDPSLESFATGGLIGSTQMGAQYTNPNTYQDQYGRTAFSPTGPRVVAPQQDTQNTSSLGSMAPPVQTTANMPQAPQVQTDPSRIVQQPEGNGGQSMAPEVAEADSFGGWAQDVARGIGMVMGGPIGLASGLAGIAFTGQPMHAADWASKAKDALSPQDDTAQASMMDPSRGGLAGRAGSPTDITGGRAGRSGIGGIGNTNDSNESGSGLGGGSSHQSNGGLGTGTGGLY